MNKEINYKNIDVGIEKNRIPEWLEKIRKYYVGEMHAHSQRSNRGEMGGSEDGRLYNDKRLMQYADKLGLDFVVFSEHASNTGSPEPLKETHSICRSLLEQQKDIDEINSSDKYSPMALSAVETSIFFNEDGEATLDLPDSVLHKLDLVIASRHGIAEQREPEKIKESLLTAIHNPEVDIIGHPYRNVEFYDNDWNYFKKYFRKDTKVFNELDAIEKEKQWVKIKQIIGKTELIDGGRTEDLHSLFLKLKNEYWEMWDEVLNEMEKRGKAFEINLNVFSPNKKFYQTLLKKAALRKGLMFTISYDFHNLDQQREFKDDNIEERLDEIKNPGRARAAQRLLGLTSLLENFGIEPERVVNSSLDNLRDFKDKREEMRNIQVLGENNYEKYCDIEQLSKILNKNIVFVKAEEVVVKNNEIVKFFIKCGSDDGVEYYFRKNSDYDLKKTFELMNLVNGEMLNKTNTPLYLSETQDVMAYEAVQGEVGREKIIEGTKKERDNLANGSAKLIGEFHGLDAAEFRSYVNVGNSNLEQVIKSISIDLVDTIKSNDKSLGNELESVYSELVKLEEEILKNSELVLIHGDFHPGNVLLDKQGNTQFIDLKNITMGVRERDLASMLEQVYAQCTTGENKAVDVDDIEKWQENFLNSYKGDIDSQKLLFYRAWISWRNSIYCFSKYYLGKKKRVDIDNGKLFLNNSLKFLEEYKK